MKDDTIYINYTQIGKFTKNAKEFKHKLLSYDQEKDIVIFNEIFNIDNNNSTFKFLENETLFIIVYLFIYLYFFNIKKNIIYIYN